MPDYEAALTGDIRGMKIGVPTNYFLDGVDPDVMAAFETAVEALKQLGAVIVPVTVPLMDAVATYGSILSRVEGAAIHAQWMRERPQDYAIHLNARLYASYGIPATIYVEALARRGEILKAVAGDVFSKVAAFIVPTIRIKAPTLKQADVDAGAEGAIEYFNNLSVNTRPMNYLGLPSVSLPCGLDFERLADRPADPGPAVRGRHDPEDRRRIPAQHRSSQEAAADAGLRTGAKSATLRHATLRRDLHVTLLHLQHAPVLDDAPPGPISVLARKRVRPDHLLVDDRIEDFAVLALRLVHVGAVEPAEAQLGDERDILGLAVHRPQMLVLGRIDNCAMELPR